MTKQRPQATSQVRPFTRAMIAVVVVLLLAGVTWRVAGQGPPAANPRAVLDQAVADFFAVRIPESVAGFDRLVKLQPSVAPELWQRGIALYYAGRYADCRAQFESHRTVNPADVENAAWHYLCVARAESPARARAALLPVGEDDRVPMREVYQMFQGRLSPDAVLVAGGVQATPPRAPQASAPDAVRARFYALLYVGLYSEAHGEARAKEYLTRAAAAEFAGAAGYMHRVAQVHVAVRGWKTK